MLGVPAKNSTRPSKYSRTQKEREKQKNVVCVFMPACVCVCARFLNQILITLVSDFLHKYSEAATSCIE